MLLTRVETACFRNLRPQLITPHPRCTVLEGDNAQGKTNFLEALHLVASLRSFRANRCAELIRFGEKEARVRAAVVDGEVAHELEVRVTSGGRRAVVDGKGVRGLRAYLGQLNVVLFTPEDLRVPRGAPAERRRMLDRAMSGVWPAYVDIVRDYQQVLRSRNRVLRDVGARGRALLEVYEAQLAELGAKMVAGRVRYLRALRERLREAYQRISGAADDGGGGGEATVVYLAAPAVAEAGDRLPDLTAALGRELAQRRTVDVARASTTCGPHVDDVDFLLDGRSTRAYGSQGQVRGLVLAFKLAQIADAQERLGSYPALLLDDVSSELDPRRNQNLFELVSGIPCQTFLTTTWAAVLPLPADRLQLRVVDGELQPSNS